MGAHLLRSAGACEHPVPTFRPGVLARAFSVVRSPRALAIAVAWAISHPCGKRAVRKTQHAQRA
eukprot:9971713-Alexandrium_andersonii.AAC.1